MGIFSSDQRLERIERALSARDGQGVERTLGDLLGRIEAALVVRDPGNARSAEAYEGLRRQVVRASKERQVHLMQLLRFRDALESDVDREGLNDLVAGWILEAGLQQVTSAADAPQLFEVLEGDGPVLEVVRPAWVEEVEGFAVPVRLGAAVARLEPAEFDPVESAEAAEESPADPVRTSVLEEQEDPR